MATTVTVAAKASPGSVLARTVAGMGWIVGWRMATRLLGLVSTLILVRLLVPADFGLVALGTSFVVAVDTLSMLGVEDVLIREHAPTPAMYDTAFTMTVLRSVATAVLIAVTALPIAGFFAEPRLAHVLWALASGTLIAGFGSIGVVDFRRDMAFEKEFLLQILPRLIGIAVTIVIAWVWHSYWALIAGILAGRIVRTLFSYRMHAWRPRLSLSAWRLFFGFSLWSWAIGIAQLGCERIDSFVVGRVLNPTAVGIYAIGEEVAALPTSELVLPLCRACYSGFAVARSAGHNMNEMFMRPVAATFMITLPAGLGISLVADPLVRLTIGEKWASAIPIIELLGIMGSLAVFGYVASALLWAHAMLRLQFSVSLASLTLRLLLLIPLVSQFGVLGAAIGTFAALVIEHSILMVLTFHRFRLDVKELIRRVWRTATAAGVMGIVLVTTGLGWTQTVGDTMFLVYTLVATVALGMSVYVLILSALWWLSGRPEGAEADILAIGMQFIHKLITKRKLSSG